jgi:hypothetical protein
MGEKTFDNIISGLSALGAKITAINAKPFMPDENTRSRIRTRTLALTKVKDGGKRKARPKAPLEPDRSN